MSTSSPLNELRYRPVDPVAALATATEHLYTSFASVAFDPTMPQSPVSASHADVAALGRPVATLAPDLVARFVLKAGTTWGGPDDIRRIVPRALELAADHRLPVDRRLLWTKLRWAGWPDWPTYQALTVRAFLRAEWGRLLRSPPRPAHLAHRWLRHTASGVDDLVPFLDDWHDALGPLTPPVHHRAATGHLVVLLVGSPLRPERPETVGELFPANRRAAQALTDWLTGPGTAHELQRSAVALADTTDSRRVSVAVERLARFRAAVARAEDDQPADGPGSGRPEPG